MKDEGGEGPPNKRRQVRFLTDLDLVLLEPSGAVIDDKAKAHDISSAGFRAETRLKLKEGAKLGFLLVMDEGSVRGQAQIVWVSPDQWGWYHAGAKITKISWRDARRLRRQVYTPGYDFWGLAKLFFKALFWAVLVLGLHNVIFHQPVVRKVLLDLWPVLVAVFVLGWSLRALLSSPPEDDG